MQLRGYWLLEMVKTEWEFVFYFIARALSGKEGELGRLTKNIEICRKILQKFPTRELKINFWFNNF
jgi:hypothetical protein